MPLSELALLFGAGFVGGMMNTVAGGGTFVTFPALVFTGVPVVAANATATFAALPGYLAGAAGFRAEVLRFDRTLLRRLTFWTLIGGAIGSLLLRVSSDEAFGVVVPFLLLAATLAFVLGDRARDFAARHRSGIAAFGIGTLLPVAVYGGYFNGGLGIILLALFSLWGMVDLHAMNGLKSWLSFALSMVSAVIFVALGMIHWTPALLMMVGTIIGGYLGAPVARWLPRSVLRALIAAVGFGMTAIFFQRLFQ